MPMQSFSYCPAWRCRACGRSARCAAGTRRVRSIGGSTPWSKMRICVRSRMPMMWPWHGDLVAGAQLEDLALVRDREGHLVRRPSVRPPCPSRHVRRSIVRIAAAPAREPPPGWGRHPPPSLPILPVESAESARKLVPQSADCFARTAVLGRDKRAVIRPPGRSRRRRRRRCGRSRAARPSTGS